MKEPAAVVRDLKHWEKLTIVEGMLYRVSRLSMLRTMWFQFVVPNSLRAEVMKGTHDQVIRARTLSLVRQRFFWLYLDRLHIVVGNFSHVPCQFKDKQ